MMPAMIRTRPISARMFGIITMITEPISGPERDLRPPMVTASRNSTVNSKL